MLYLHICTKDHLIYLRLRLFIFDEEFSEEASEEHTVNAAKHSLSENFCCPLFKHSFILTITPPVRTHKLTFKSMN